jgi:hypothetical protein
LLLGQGSEELDDGSGHQEPARHLIAGKPQRSAQSVALRIGQRGQVTADRVEERMQPRDRHAALWLHRPQLKNPGVPGLLRGIPHHGTLPDANPPRTGPPSRTAPDERPRAGKSSGLSRRGIDVLAGLGQRWEAIEAYEQLRDALEETYAAEPEPQTKALYLQLLSRGKPMLAARAAGTEQNPSPHTRSLVGRQPEWNDCGHPGSGKARETRICS